jgi:hypothetical protein
MSWIILKMNLTLLAIIVFICVETALLITYGSKLFYHNYIKKPYSKINYFWMWFHIIPIQRKFQFNVSRPIPPEIHYKGISQGGWSISKCREN